MFEGRHGVQLGADQALMGLHASGAEMAASKLAHDLLDGSLVLNGVDQRRCDKLVEM